MWDAVSSNYFCLPRKFFYLP